MAEEAWESEHPAEEELFGTMEDEQSGPEGAETADEGGPSHVILPGLQDPIGVTASAEPSGRAGFVPLHTIEMIFPLASERSSQGYHRLCVMLGDQSLVAAVPVKVDSQKTSILLVVPAGAVANADQPMCPDGRAPIAPLACSDGVRTCQGSGLFLVWDAAHLGEGLVYDLDAVEGADVVGFGRQGGAWPSGASVLLQAEKLGYSQSGEQWESCAEGPLEPPDRRRPKASKAKGGGASSDSRTVPRSPPPRVRLNQGDSERIDSLVERLHQFEASQLSAKTAQLRAEEASRVAQRAAAAEQRQHGERMSRIETMLMGLSEQLQPAGTDSGKGRGPRRASDAGGAPASVRPGVLRPARTEAPGAAEGHPSRGLSEMRGLFSGPNVSELGRGKLAAGRTAEGLRTLAEEVEVSSEEDHTAGRPRWGPRAEDPMGALLLSAAELLRHQGSAGEKKKKKGRKPIFGLTGGSDSEGSEASDDDGGMGGRLKGVKGARLQGKLERAMAAHPEEFYRDMRERMVGHLAEQTDGPRRSFQYAQQMPLEKQKVLGYFAWSVAHLDGLLYEDRVPEAKLCCLRLLACIDQHLLDGHWSTSWPIVGVAQEPPWPAWERTAVNTYRRTHTTSPLLNEMWVAASLSRIKDEQFLRKQRFAPGAQQSQTQETERPGGKGGRGRGKGSGEQGA